MRFSHKRTASRCRSFLLVVAALSLGGCSRPVAETEAKAIALEFVQNGMEKEGNEVKKIDASNYKAGDDDAVMVTVNVEYIDREGKKWKQEIIPFITPKGEVDGVFSTNPVTLDPKATEDLQAAEPAF